MSNIYARTVNFGGNGGGGNALVVATRSDNGDPAVFADFATLETYAATTSGTNDANSINVSDANDAMEVFGVGTISSGQVTSLTAAYIRLNNAWVAVATNLVGSPGQDGQDGQDGLDGNTFEFHSIAARDTFFTNNPDMLVHDMPIMVTVEARTVSNQVWEGATAPASYTAATDAVLWMDASVRVGTSSFDLGEIHTISSGGENVFFTNNDSGINYFPPWQYVGDHRTEAGRTVLNRPTARVYGDLLTEEITGPAATGGAVDFNTTVTLTRDESIFGIRVIAGETYTGQVEFRITAMNTAALSFTFFDDLVKAPGDDIIFWFPYPAEGLSGREVMIEMVRPDGTHLQVRPLASDVDTPFFEIRFRQFTDTGLAFLRETAHNFVEVTANLDITNDNLADYNKRALYVPETATGFLTINLALDLNNFEYIEFINFNVNAVTISVGPDAPSGGEINGEFDIAFTQYEGGRIIQEPGNIDNFAVIFDNSDPDMLDNFVDSVDASVSGQDLTITLGRNGILPDLTDTVTLPSGGGSTAQQLISVTSDLTIDSSNVDTYEGNIVYIPSSYVGANDITITVTVDLNFVSIDFVNFAPSRNMILESTGSGQINGQASVTLEPTHGGRLVDEPSAGGEYHLIFQSTDDEDNYVDSVTVSGQTLTLGRTGTLPDLTATLPSASASGLESLINNSGETISAELRPELCRYQ